MKWHFLLILLLVFAACEAPRDVQKEASCDPPNYIINGNCCLDRDFNGECDDAVPAPAPQQTAPQAPTIEEEPEEEVILSERDVTCSYDAETLTFSFRNLAQKQWKIDNNLPWGSPGTIEGIKVYFDQYQINKKGGQFREGDPMFGALLFSDLCTGDGVLDSGEETICTMGNVPLQSEEYLGGVHELRISVPSLDWNPRVEFTCD